MGCGSHHDGWNPRSVATLARRFRADVACNNSIIVEVKAVDALGTNDERQLINYLQVTGMARGLILNFSARWTR